MAVPHTIQRRYLPEQLVSLRQAYEQPRYAAAQKQGRIDPNPHQVKLAEIYDEINKKSGALRNVAARSIDLAQKIDRSRSQPSPGPPLPRG